MRDFIDSTSFISAKIVKGKQVYIGKGVQIIGKGLVEIGDKTAIAWESLIISDNHDYKNTTPGGIDVTIPAPIKIGKHCWIGARCIILWNTEIGDDVVIGAGSVVRGKIRSGYLAFGNPCKEIKKRKRVGR